MPRLKSNTIKDKYILPDNYIYISHLDEDFKFWRLPVTPDSITDSMSSNFQPSNALGRSAPVYTYNNSGPRTVSISLKFRRDMMDDVNIGLSNAVLQKGEDYVDNLIKALQAIAVPRYNLTNRAVEPPLVALRLSNQVFIKGIVNGEISITYGLPILADGKYAQVSINLTIIEVDAYDATSVFANGSFRGVVSTLKAGMGLVEGDD